MLPEHRRISADQLKQWSRCRKQYYYKAVLGLRWPASQSNFELGQAVHKLMDYQSRQLPLAQLLEQTKPEISQAYKSLSTHQLAKATIIANEWAFHVPVYFAETEEPVWLVGRIDRVALLEKEGRPHLIVIDWKTGTAVPKNPEQAWQTQIYLYALVEAAGQLGYAGLKPEQVSFAYVEVRQNLLSEVILPYDEQKHKAALENIKKTLAHMAEETLYEIPKTGCPDRYCQYNSICGVNQDTDGFKNNKNSQLVEADALVDWDLPPEFAELF